MFFYKMGLNKPFFQYLQLDGWIARTWESQASKMGSFLDPMADKILIATLFLSLTYADLIPIGLTSLIIARDLLLVVAGFVIRYQSLPPPVSNFFSQKTNRWKKVCVKICILERST